MGSSDKYKDALAVYDRKVQLLCEDRVKDINCSLIIYLLIITIQVVCVADSHVIITSQDYLDLIHEHNVGIGQLFR